LLGGERRRAAAPLVFVIFHPLPPDKVVTPVSQGARPDEVIE
jgi:hypothetical protein